MIPKQSLFPLTGAKQNANFSLNAVSTTFDATISRYFSTNRTNCVINIAKFRRNWTTERS